MKPAVSLPGLAPGSLLDIVPMETTRFIVVVFLICSILYVVALAVHRLYLSPLAKFPGPKLAALTQWYEIYYDVFKNGGGQFTFEIKRMHEKYGESASIHGFELIGSNVR